MSQNNTAWVLEGLTVTGLYLDSIPVTGKITLSRVKYGGTVSHHVQLDKPVEVYGALRDTVILDHKQIQTVKG
jgi:hypothetical protein